MPIKFTPKRSKHRYTRRLILFIDFLGFKELVDRTIEDEQFLDRLIEAMDAVRNIGKAYKQLYRTQRITQFSDCVVVSYEADEPSAVFNLLNAVSFCVIQLASQGFLLRGGLTVGELHHTRKHVVGPAMIEAYHLESKYAIYPRIVIDPKVVEVARQAHSEDHVSSDEEQYVRAFLTIDEDKQYFFEYVSWNSVVNQVGCEDQEYPGYLQSIGQIIKNGLRSCDQSVLKKILWLHKQYVAAIDFFEAIPADHPYRNANWEICKTIESLPKMDEPVRTARKLIAIIGNGSVSGVKSNQSV